ncbi:MAG TPA: flagellar motor switch protein FliM [Thermodesulfobacteriota bacterium]|nr:flagellar motor switch protein FliM [Thermodesulfobacteriota bacterium]
MDKILSQEEIDALLKGIETGKVDTTPSPSPKVDPGVAPFDFANQDRIIGGRMPTLEILNDSFARMLRNPLSLMLRKGLDILPQSVQLIRYGDFIRTLTVPSSLHIFKMDPLRGHSVLGVDSKLVFSFIDIFMGGTGKMVTHIEGRDFTALESKLVHKVVTLILTELEKAWTTIHPVSVQYVRSEYNPQFASIVPPSDLILVVPFSVESEQFSGLINLCIPYSNLEPIKKKLYSGYQTENLEVDQGWTERLKEQLKGTEVEVVVEFAKTLVPAERIVSLKVGDVLQMGKEWGSEPILARVQGVPKFVGKAGTYGSNKAFQIEGTTDSL